MKRLYKLWLWIFAIYFIINLIYLFMAKSFWWVNDGYGLILTPTLIFCVAGGCGMLKLIFLILISSLIISGILAGIIWLFINRKK